MSKFLEWFDRNRRTIGYCIGTANIIDGTLLVIFGEYSFGIFWMLLGAFIVFDSWEMKYE
jgi:hypothetical protein